MVTHTWNCYRRQSKVLVSSVLLFMYGVFVIKVSILRTFNGKDISEKVTDRGKDISKMKTRKYKEDDRIGELTDVHDDMPSENAGYVKGLETMREARFLAPELVVSPGQQFISLGMIAINLQNSKTLPEGFTKATKKTFASLFKFSSGTPLHLIVITNKKSLKSVGRFLSGLVSSLVSMRVILSPGWRWRRMKGVPLIRIDYVDSEKIIEKNYDFVKALKANTVQAKDHKGQKEDKYSADLFYIAPTYHLAFLALEKMIVIDISDLEFHEDVKVLNDQFKNMSDVTLIGVGLDLSPNYHFQLTKYRDQHAGSQLGFPGPLQGEIMNCENFSKT